MREIKFRSWLNEKKQMIYDLDYHSYDEGYFVSNSRVYRSYWDSSDNCKCSYEIDDCEVLQYTGLKDKNGKEIYEGDIVICEALFSSKSFKKKQHRAVVTYQIGSFIPKSIGEIYVLNFDNCEVIGNIYENPELLK